MQTIRIYLKDIHSDSPGKPCYHTGDIVIKEHVKPYEGAFKSPDIMKLIRYSNYTSSKREDRSYDQYCISDDNHLGVDIFRIRSREENMKIRIDSLDVHLIDLIKADMKDHNHNTVEQAVICLLFYAENTTLSDGEFDSITEGNQIRSRITHRKGDFYIHFRKDSKPFL